MPEKDFWLALSLCLLYSFTFLGNVTILAVIKVEQHLHEPMYFLAMLVATDFSLPLSSVPTTISVHWLSWCSVTRDVCITEMFFIHTFGGVESGVLVAMAFDAALWLLKLSSTTLPFSLMESLAGLGNSPCCGVWGLCAPVPLLIKRLPFYHSNTLSHACCLHQDAMRLACADTHVNRHLRPPGGGLRHCGRCLVSLGLFFLIFQAVLGIACLGRDTQSSHTCLSHICAVRLFYYLLLAWLWFTALGSICHP